MVLVDTPTVLAIRSQDGKALTPEGLACSARTMSTHFSVGFVLAGASYIAQKMAGRLTTTATAPGTDDRRPWTRLALRFLHRIGQSAQAAGDVRKGRSQPEQILGDAPELLSRGITVVG